MSLASVVKSFSNKTIDESVDCTRQDLRIEQVEKTRKQFDACFGTRHWSEKALWSPTSSPIIYQILCTPKNQIERIFFPSQEKSFFVCAEGKWIWKYDFLKGSVSAVQEEGSTVYDKYDFHLILGAIYQLLLQHDLNNSEHLFIAAIEKVLFKCPANMPSYNYETDEAPPYYYLFLETMQSVKPFNSSHPFIQRQVDALISGSKKMLRDYAKHYGFLLSSLELLLDEKSFVDLLPNIIAAETEEEREALFEWFIMHCKPLPSLIQTSKERLKMVERDHRDIIAASDKVVKVPS